MLTKNLFDEAPEPAAVPHRALELVFVYGSLKRGYSNHRLLDSTARFIGTAHTPPRFDLLDFGFYPAAIRGKHIVTGEVFEVDETVMKALDKLEGNGTFYLRKKIPIVLTGKGKQVLAWIYLYLNDDGLDELIPPEGNLVTW